MSEVKRYVVSEAAAKVGAGGHHHPATHHGHGPEPASHAHHGGGHQHKHHEGHDHAGHDHAAHGGHHHHGPRGYVHMQRALAIGIVLNLVFVLFEVIAAQRSGSLALYSDAAHNFGDLISLVFAWGATMLARRKPSAEFTYGLRGSTILASLLNGILLLIASCAIAYAALSRLAHPAPVAGGIVAAVALLGVVTNGASALVLAGHRHDDLNARGAFLHLVSDAALSVAVIISGLLVRATGFTVIDTAMSLCLALIILVSTLRLLAESVRLVLQGVPHSIDSKAVHGFLVAQPGVETAHDLHIWAMSTAENAMTAHLVMPAGHPGDRFIADLAVELDRRFKVGHVTLQVETGRDCHACGLQLELV